MFSDKEYSFRSGVPKVYHHIKNKSFTDWEIPPWDLYINKNQKVGEGSFGSVYISLWRKTKVISKVINPEQRKDLFIKEFDTLTKVHHPNVVQLLGYVETPFIIVMEHLPKGNLKVFLKNNRVGHNKRIHICLDVLRALAYLHNRKPEKIIHRDVKPTNIVISQSGRAKLVDFGLSRMLLEKPQPADDEYMTGDVGTLYYMAPEAKGGKDYSHKIDIWSAGIVFREMLPRMEGVYTHMIQTNPLDRWEALNLIDLVWSNQSSCCFSL
jgi:serine/threonine protein kinase